MKESHTVPMPATVEEAARQLDDLGQLATATEWHRAAIVATFVEVQPEGRPRRETPDSGSFESAAAFARRGIVGLSSDSTVAIYAKAWLDRFPRPVRGTAVELPDETWPPTTELDHRHAHTPDRDAITAQAQADGTGAAKAVDIAKNTKAMAAAIKASPRVAAAARAALAATALPTPPRITDRGKSRDQLAEEAFWQSVRGALGVLLEAIPRIDDAPADIAMMFQIIRPAGDWDDALATLVER